MIELVALIVACAVAIASTSYALKMRKELNQLWDRVAVNDVHIQRIQEKVQIEPEPEESRAKVKALQKRSK
jgi:hypothetical protein